ncbi:MAG: biopolymer transporter ExbD [Planctomycetes bacterium]|nr:biopolymer transporter ExbD [Planctomycetota bacterium]
MRKGPPEPAGERIPNLAPMVDIIMVLLIFFLLGASLSLVKEGILQTELDERSGPGEGAAVEINPTIRIALEDSGDGSGCNIYVMDEPLRGNTFEHLRRFMQERRQAGADPQNAVVIGGQTTVRWKYIVKAMDAAVRAGFQNVQFAVSSASSEAGG